MSQNAAIDVAIGLILMYLMLSLLCTVINEFIATKLRLRARSLASALKQLLDNPTLCSRFYQHGLIVGNKLATATGAQSTLDAVGSIASDVKNMVSSSPTAPPAPVVAPAAGAAASVATAPAPAPDKDHPSYLSGRSVALALIGSLDPTKPLPAMGDLQNAVQGLPPSRIRDTLLSSLTEAGNDIDKLRTSIATWFDDSMERLSGAYKRQLKWISMITGLVVAIVFNADSLTVASTLWGDQASRASVLAIATKVAQERAPTTPESVDSTKLRETIERTQNLLHSLPIGWHCDADRSPTTASSATRERTLGFYWTCAATKLPTVTAIQIIGWVLTAIALSLGAPFWFDLLQKFMNVRGAGAKPKREDDKAAA
jgi:hypothetical protein